MENRKLKIILDDANFMNQLILDNIPLLMDLVDEDGTVLFADKKIESLLGESPVGKKCWMVYKDDKMPCVDCPLKTDIPFGKAIIHEVNNVLGGKTCQVNHVGIIYKGKKTILEIFQDVTERKKDKEEIEHNYDTQAVVNSILTNSLLDIPFPELLKRALLSILSIPWLSFERRGCIFLVDETGENLAIKVNNDISEQVQKNCGKIPFGKCLCGQAALTQKTMFLDCIDKDHQDYSAETILHGHYCVPIIHFGKTIGVINIYLKYGHKYDEKEVLFLNTVANTLAGIIDRNYVKERSKILLNTIEQTAEIIFITDRDGIIKYVNPSFEANTGFTKEESFNKTPKILKSGIMETEYYKKLWDTILSGKIIHTEVINKKKNGELFNYDQTITPMKDHDGNITHFISTGRDITDIKLSEEKIKQNLVTLKKIFEDTVNALASTTEVRDPYTAEHQMRVVKLACRIAEELNVSNDQFEGIRLGGILHDLGKIYIPSEILNKPGKLSDIELSLIKTHPTVTFKILSKIEFPWPVANIAAQHHERLNGSGYPLGLKEKDILFESRILAVADVVEAMASHRPYRPALGIDKAFEEILKNKSILYDPIVVDACLKIFKEKGFRFE